MTDDLITPHDPLEYCDCHQCALEFRNRYKAELARISGELAGGLSDLTDVLGWRPITTAPTDGSHVQLYRLEIQFVGYYGGAESGWRINAPGLPAMWPLPTHWAQLRSHPNAGVHGRRVATSRATTG